METAGGDGERKKPRQCVVSVLVLVLVFAGRAVVTGGLLARGRRAIRQERSGTHQLHETAAYRLESVVYRLYRRLSSPDTAYFRCSWVLGEVDGRRRVLAWMSRGVIQAVVTVATVVTAVVKEQVVMMEEGREA